MKTSINLLTKSLVLLSVLSACTTDAASSIVINWHDNSSNEDGFIVEKMQMGDSEFTEVSQLPENSTSYTDYDFIKGETYCYKVSSYNSAGEQASAEKCATIDSDKPVDPDKPVEPVTGVQITSLFTPYSEVVDIEGREFYGFKSDVLVNSEYANEDISNVYFDVGEGNISYTNNGTVFVDQDTEIESGYAGVKFNESNSVDFTLSGSGENQSATIYMKVGVWTNDTAGIVVQAGDKTHNIIIPKGYTWHYLAVNVDFQDSVDVNISTIGNYAGYSQVYFAGVTLNNKNENESNEATVDNISLDADAIIDVSNSAYIAANGNTGNLEYSDATITSLDFVGKTKFSDKTYTLESNGTEVASGYEGMNWSPENGVKVQVASENYGNHIASLYFRAGAWTNDEASLNLKVNGVEHNIDLPKTRAMYYIKVDVNFTGKALIELNPNGTFGSYSQLLFAGATVE